MERVIDVGLAEERVRVRLEVIVELGMPAAMVMVDEMGLGEVPDAPVPILVEVAALDDEPELYHAAAYYVGVDPCTEDPADARKILDVLLAQKPKLAFYNSNHPIERMTARNVALYHLWNGAAHRVRQAT